MDFVAAGEMDVVDFVDHVTKQITVDHAVNGAFENGRDNIAPVAAVGALEAPQIGEETGAFVSVRADGLLVVYKGDQLVAGYALRFSGPVAPTVGRFESQTKALTAHLAFLFANLLHVVEEFQEHDPGEHGETVEIAVEPFILAHDIAARLYDRG